MKKRSCATSVLFCFTLTALGQPELDAMRDVRRDLTSSFFASIDASLVLAGILGIVGAVKIYHNWQMGKDRITADVAAWFFAALFIVLAGPFVRALFDI